MSLFTLLTSSKSRSSRKQVRGTRHQRMSPKRTTAKPRLERLEDRTVLSSWVLGLLGSPSSSNIPTSVTVDAEGSSFVAGQLQGTVDFDAGPGTTNLTSAGGDDIFVAKYAPDGSLLWAQRWGGSVSDSASDMLVDSSGNLFLTGYFGATISMGNTTLVSTGPGDAFAAKIDGATGNVLWAQKMGGDSFDGGNGVALSPNEAELWVTGSFWGPGTFGSITLPVGGYSNGFAAKLNTANGEVAWAGELAGGIASKVAVDSAGNAYVTGFSPIVTGVSNGGVFLAKLDSAGSSVWAKTMEGSLRGQWVRVNDAGHVILAAGTQSGIPSTSTDFDPGPGVAAVATQSAVAEYTPDGELVWVEGSEGFIAELALGASGDIFVCGVVSETDDVDPGPGIVSAVGDNGDNDGFVARLTATGNTMWVRRLGGSLVDSASGITVDSVGNVFAVGSYSRGSLPAPSNTADFPTGDTLPGPGMFVMKLEQLPSGQLPFATISGRVFNDENQNGLADDGLTMPLSTVYLDANNNGQLDAGETSTTTYASGMYTFNALADGTYQVRQVLPAGWSRTTPAAAYAVTVNLGSGTDQLFTGKDFGNYQITAPTKFYVVNDGSPDRTYEYRYNGGAIENYAINSGNSAPRGAASTAAGDKVWVVDANKKVYVYNTSGGLLGSWSAGSLASNATVQGIATNGTDVWIVDSRQDRVYRYSGAATRLSGSQNAASSFALNSGNKDASDLVTDGANLWVLNNSSTDKVFKYQVSGYYLGNWTITSGGGSPTGITIDPTNVSNIWIVDNNSDRVYEFTAAASRTSGSQSSSSSFPLVSGNTNPQGIADPPVPSSGGITTSRTSFSTDSAFDSALLSIVGELDGLLTGGKKRK